MVKHMLNHKETGVDLESRGLFEEETAAVLAVDQRPWLCKCTAFLSSCPADAELRCGEVLCQGKAIPAPAPRQ